MTHFSRIQSRRRVTIEHDQNCVDNRLIDIVLLQRRRYVCIWSGTLALSEFQRLRQIKWRRAVSEQFEENTTAGKVLLPMCLSESKAKETRLQQGH